MTVMRAKLFFNALMHLILFCCYPPLWCQAPNNEQKEFLRQQELLSAGLAQESIYLRTSKTIYETEEDLWFCATVLNSQILAPSVLSEILYVELRHERSGSPLIREMYSLENGFCFGHLAIPDSLEEGKYWLTAFTANSLSHIGQEVKSSQPIVIKKSIIPPIFSSLVFDKQYYSHGDGLNAKIKIRTPAGEPAKNLKVVAELIRGSDRVVRRKKGTTNENGALQVEYKDIGSADNLTLNIVADNRDINFGNTLNAKVPINPHKNVQLQFLPEGGNLVGGHINTVAFKAVSQTGKPS